MASSSRTELLRSIASSIAQLPAKSFLKIAIDGVDGAGKTTFADELAPILRSFGKEVIRASVDGFHNPRSVRHRLGRNSPEGFFRDSYNYDVLKEVLLNPLSEGGSGIY